jgi:proteasome lid subunit RPN8/RPN11
LGYYHSHTRTRATPSRLDLQAATPDWILVIVSGLYDEVRAFKHDGTEIDLTVG